MKLLTIIRSLSDKRRANALRTRTERRRGIRGALSRYGFKRISYSQSTAKGEYSEVWHGKEGTITVQWEVA
jgi:hypothetical protein